MPNWCFNELVVSSDNTEQLKKFKQDAEVERVAGMDGDATALSLNKIVPMPASVGEGEGWYNWRIENWGTKWDVEAELHGEDDNYLEYSFDSAWSPPIQWLEKASAKYPELHFRLKYEEGGMGFMGVATADNGKVLDKCLEY